jgi:pimeloyl-ACP methyl ester carboxylesterase
VLDTRRALELNLSNGVAREFLAASPIEHAPLGVPTLLTHGGRDDIVPVELSERFAAAAGDEADLVIEPDEDHFGHLDPSNPLWEAVIRWL